MEHKKQFWAPFWSRIFTAAAITLTAFCIAPLLAPLWTRNASGESVANATAPSEQSKLGVIVTNETNTNIVVFSVAGAQGVTVPPGGFCFAQCPPEWNYLTIKVVRCGKDGDMEDPDNPVTFQMDGVKVHRVEPREF